MYLAPNRIVRGTISNFTYAWNKTFHVIASRARLDKQLKGKHCNVSSKGNKWFPRIANLMLEQFWDSFLKHRVLKCGIPLLNHSGVTGIAFQMSSRTYHAKKLYTNLLQDVCWKEFGVYFVTGWCFFKLWESFLKSGQPIGTENQTTDLQALYFALGPYRSWFPHADKPLAPCIPTARARLSPIAILKI